VNISRRKFFFFGLAAGVGLLLPDRKIITSIEDKEEIIRKIRQITKEAMNEYRREIDASIYGIPYHQNNASSGIWLGLSRS